MKQGDVLIVGYDGLKSLVNRFAENADVYERLAFLWEETARSETHFLILENDRKIVAAGSVKPDREDKSVLWLTQVSVDPAYKHKGHATKILSRVFSRAASEGLTLAATAFEEEGFEYLGHVMPRLHMNYPDLKIRYRSSTGETVDGSRPYILARPYSTGWPQIFAKWDDGLASLVCRYGNYLALQKADQSKTGITAAFYSLRAVFREKMTGIPLYREISKALRLQDGLDTGQYEERRRQNMRIVHDLAVANKSNVAHGITVGDLRL